MSILCYEEKERWMQKNVETAFEILEIEDKFLKEYLLSWVPCYLEEVLRRISYTLIKSGR